MELADLDPDPIEQFRRWYDDVRTAGLPEPSAMVLTTAPAEAGAQPLSRHVLLKGADAAGFTWVSNHRSRKGRHLAANPKACLLFPWFPLGRQVIVTGSVAVAPDEESDAYFSTRPRSSQVAAWASEQSTPVPLERSWLDARWRELHDRFDGRAVPRPPHWGMYRLVPDAIELWSQGEHRMHDRFRFHRADPTLPWAVERLAP